MDGVVCGHIHRAELRPIGTVLYCNTGDGVEHCTALAEAEDGALTLLRHAERGPDVALPSRTAASDLRP